MPVPGEGGSAEERQGQEMLAAGGSEGEMGAEGMHGEAAETASAGGFSAGNGAGSSSSSPAGKLPGPSGGVGPSKLGPGGGAGSGGKAGAAGSGSASPGTLSAAAGTAGGDSPYQKFLNLSDSDFSRTFGMSRDAFNAMPTWKQHKARKEKGMW